MAPEPHIAPEDPGAPDIRALLETHLALMRSISPPGSVHALDIDALRGPGITFLAARDGRGTLLGVGALKRLDDVHGEIKSMHTPHALRGAGVGQRMLERIVAEARAAGLRRLSLETGSTADFAAAHRLYQRNGFSPCAPFADYRPDPFSLFMTRLL